MFTNICIEHKSNKTPMPNPIYENHLELVLVPVCSKGFIGWKDRDMIGYVYKCNNWVAGNKEDCSSSAYTTVAFLKLASSKIRSNANWVFALSK